MVEAVFSESAGGSLKLAQAIGTDALLTPHARWEDVPPLGGRPMDVFAFDLGLSMGHISHLKPPNLLEDLRRRFAAGESLRVWYSDQPDERCGLYWLMAQLPNCEGTISSIKLPDLEVGPRLVLHRLGCAELAPEEWHRLLPLEQPISNPLRRHYADTWRALAEENAPLRAVVNGEVRSVPQDLYDGCILRELAAAGEEFHEAALIGNVLGKYRLRISDLWIHERIERLVQAGDLQALTKAEDGCPYRRMLRKTN